MSNNLNLFGKIISGKLEINNKETYKHWLSQCKEGSNIVIKLRNQEDFHSNRQLRLIYHEFRELSNLLGYTVEEIKMLLKLQFGLCFTNTIEGVELNICKSISDMTRVEISDFIQKIDLWSTNNFNYPLLNNEDIQFLKTI